MSNSKKRTWINPALMFIGILLLALFYMKFAKPSPEHSLNQGETGSSTLTSNDSSASV